MTPAEVQLWNGLRGWGFAKFRRQHALGRFILDFYCPSARLCVEVDGGIHDKTNQREHDILRSETLAEMGIRVIRVRNEEVLADPRAVLRRIRGELAPNPCSPLPLVGEGGGSQAAG